MSDFDERMQRYLVGELTAEERITFEDDVLSNPEMVDRLYADVSMRAALDTVARAKRERAVASASAEPWWRRRMLRWVAPAVAVAAVAIFVFVRPSQPPEQPPVFRSVERRLEAVEPRGDVDAVPTRFVWSSSDDAAYYRFELYDVSSTPVFDTVTADTTVTFDSTVTPVPPEGYWVVTPLNDLRVGIGADIVTQYKTAN